MAEAEWPEAQKFGGRGTPKQGLVWWCRDAETVAERQREGRLAEAAWPKARRDGGSTTVVGGSREVTEREGGDNDDDNATVAAQRWQWQHKRWWQWQHRSSCGMAGICREKWRRQRA